MKNILTEEDGKNSKRMEERWREKSAVLLKAVAKIKPSIGVRFSYNRGPGIHDSRGKSQWYCVHSQTSENDIPHHTRPDL